MRLVARTLATATVVEWGLRTSTLPALAARLDLRLDVASTEQPVIAPVMLPQAARLRLRVVDRILARWPFGTSCLRRSLVFGHLLHPYNPVLRLGVRRNGGSFAAHAWLEIDGHALDAGAAAYAPLGGTVEGPTATPPEPGPV